MYFINKGTVMTAVGYFEDRLHIKKFSSVESSNLDDLVYI